VDIKLDRGDYVGDHTTHANFGISNFIFKKGGSAYTWNCHYPCLFFIPRHYFFIPCAPVEIAPFANKTQPIENWTTFNTYN